MATDKRGFTESNQRDSTANGGIYEIKIKGFLDDHWKPWFDGLELKQVSEEETGQDYTLITGSISDQPALHGLLAKIRDLNLTLLAVYRIGSENNQHEKTSVELPLANVPDQKTPPDDLKTEQNH